MRRVAVAALICWYVATPTVATANATDQWALAYLKATQCWQTSKGTAVTVAVVDTGVQPSVSFGNRLLSGADFSASAKSVGDGRTDTSADGHGTGMASLIAGEEKSTTDTHAVGFAPDSSIMPVRVLVDRNELEPVQLSAGLMYSTDHHARVINISLSASDQAFSARNEVKYAVEHGAVVVAAAGNDGEAQVSYPAADPGVIAVTAIDQKGYLWPQSNTGPQVTLAAPGVDIYRDDDTGQQGWESGTSEAAAYVSASAALVRSEHPDWTGGQVIRALISTADRPPGVGPGHNDQYGYGIVDPLKALHAPTPAAKTNPLLSPAPVGDTSNPSSDIAPQKHHDVSNVILAGLAGSLAVLGGLALTVLVRRRSTR